MKLTTLCYIEKDDCYLMLHRIKKKNDINKDMWIGVGGHFEQDESPEECLLREVKEETGLTLTSYRMRGVITFISDESETEYMFLYTADQFEGNLRECDEGELEWIQKDQLVNLNFWTGDEIFFKLIRDDEPVFTLKLQYAGKRLLEAVLNGRKMELFDIVDENGVPTGLVRERSIAHELGTWHRTVHIWIIHEKEDGFDVLLQKRCDTKDSFPGCYDISSAGHIQAGDDYLESAIREMDEELGIQAESEELIDIGYHRGIMESEFYNRSFLNHEYSKIFVYNKPVNIEELTLQKEEVESVMWVDYKKGKELLKENIIKNCIFMDEWEMLGKNLKNIMHDLHSDQ